MEDFDVEILQWKSKRNMEDALQEQKDAIEEAKQKGFERGLKQGLLLLLKEIATNNPTMSVDDLLKEC